MLMGVVVVVVVRVVLGAGHKVFSPLNTVKKYDHFDRSGQIRIRPDRVAS